MSRQGRAIPKKPTWKRVHRPPGYKIDSDSDGAAKHTTESVLGATPQGTPSIAKLRDETQRWYP